MAKIILDDGTEREVAESDIIMRDDLDDEYVSKKDYDDLQAKYEKKKAQAKDAFKNKDLAEKEVRDSLKDEIRQSLTEEIKFANLHGFDEIPDEVREFKAKHSDLTWDEALRASGYEVPNNSNPNPGRPNKNAFNGDKKEWSQEDLAAIADDPAQFDAVMTKIESGEYKSI